MSIHAASVDIPGEQFHGQTNWPQTNGRKGGGLWLSLLQHSLTVLLDRRCQQAFMPAVAVNPGWKKCSS